MTCVYPDESDVLAVERHHPSIAAIRRRSDVEEHGGTAVPRKRTHLDEEQLALEASTIKNWIRGVGHKCDVPEPGQGLLPRLALVRDEATQHEDLIADAHIELRETFLCRRECRPFDGSDAELIAPDRCNRNVVAVWVGCPRSCGDFVAVKA